MSDSREFLIQRYADGNWPYVRGLKPFLATGPAFHSLAIPGSLEKNLEYKFGPALYDALAVLADVTEWKPVVAEWLLREGIVQAFWSTTVDTCLPPEAWWQGSVDCLAEEIPRGPTPTDAVVEYLSGLGSVAHFRSYISEDGLELTACPVP